MFWKSWRLSCANRFTHVNKKQAGNNSMNSNQYWKIVDWVEGTFLYQTFANCDAYLNILKTKMNTLRTFINTRCSNTC